MGKQKKVDWERGARYSMYSIRCEVKGGDVQLKSHQRSHRRRRCITWETINIVGPGQNSPTVSKSPSTGLLQRH